MHAPVNTTAAIVTHTSVSASSFRCALFVVTAFCFCYAVLPCVGHVTIDIFGVCLPANRYKCLNL